MSGESCPFWGSSVTPPNPYNSYVGPQGPQGYPGPVGRDGVGFPGPPGPLGLPGRQGNQGPGGGGGGGAQGYQGSHGLQGWQGSSGSFSIRTRGNLGVESDTFNVSLPDCNTSGPFDVTLVCKVKTSSGAVVHFLVNNDSFNPFKNAAETLVWGNAVLQQHSAINMLAGAVGYGEFAINVGDVLTINIRCDVPEQSLGLGMRTITVVTRHVNTSNISCIPMTTESVFVLDEGYVEGQNINSVGVQIADGTWEATSNYSLSRLNP